MRDNPCHLKKVSVALHATGDGDGKFAGTLYQLNQAKEYDKNTIVSEELVDSLMLLADLVDVSEENSGAYDHSSSVDSS